MKIKIKYLIIGIVLGLVITYMFSLVKCEILTQRHYDEFKDAYKQNTMLGEVEFFKVLEYETCSVAKVYYISKDKAGGNVLTFAYEDGKWNEVYWNTIWSKTGSADDVVYPYLWHWIYFLVC